MSVLKREEKSEKSRTRILEAAIKEYGEKAYGETSINKICIDNGISKGLIYHYFGNVDKLFLACVEECFTKLYEYLKENTLTESTDVRLKMQSYFEARSVFFEQNPYLRNIFCTVMFQRPKHLNEEIEKRREKLNDFNNELIRDFIEHVPLRDDITKDTAMTYFMMLGDAYNNFFSVGDFSLENTDTKFENHEKFMMKVIDIFLFGIAKRDENL